MEPQPKYNRIELDLLTVAIAGILTGLPVTVLSIEFWWQNLKNPPAPTPPPYPIPEFSCPPDTIPAVGFEIILRNNYGDAAWQTGIPGTPGVDFQHYFSEEEYEQLQNMDLPPQDKKMIADCFNRDEVIFKYEMFGVELPEAGQKIVFEK